MSIQHSLSYNDYVAGIPTLSPEEQMELVELIVAHLKVALLKNSPASGSKLARLRPRRLIQGDPDDLVNLKVWTWNEEQEH